MTPERRNRLEAGRAPMLEIGEMPWTDKQSTDAPVQAVIALFLAEAVRTDLCFEWGPEEVPVPQLQPPNLRRELRGRLHTGRFSGATELLQAGVHHRV